MSQPKRKMSNLMLTPRFQLKLTYYYIGVGLLIIVGTVSGVFYKMSQIRDVLNNSIATDFSSQSQITEHTFQIAQISMVGFVSFAVASFIFAIMVSHRVAGPTLAITAYIDELKKGNFEYGRQLRPEDELVPIMDGLHELNEILKSKDAG
ncbi:MAG: nitrogen fixation/metabolism regulation signal transduction histidine kinase [Candidatus Azotimanducaceae bacterium]|jgi:nitrogen fixation/metabolism regulation signal transduction histidine kinase